MSGQDPPKARAASRRTAALRIAVLLLVGAAVIGWATGRLDPLVESFDADALRPLVDRAGIRGPLVVIALMMLAVVASPLPSAPIAIAAGAAYGHYAGALYVAIGSVLGATAAFLIARFLGRDAVRRILGGDPDRGLLGSQTALMLIVFVSRLLPFVSFDAISYAAGLSAIRPWRFVVATLAGIAPASFVLAHVGSAAVQGNPGPAAWLAGGLGLLTGGGLLLAALHRFPQRRDDPTGGAAGTSPAGPDPRDPE